MQDVIVYTTDTGGVAVVIPAAASGLSLAQIAVKDVPAGRVYAVVPAADIPSDRTFRDAWVLRNSRVEHDMSKAKAIAHDRRRAKRAGAFAPLDIEATIPAKAAAAEAKRQAIRDADAALQTQIAAALTVDALKTLLDGMA
jgi:hypothetical protein